MERILVGVDGSAAGRDALAWSADLARRLRRELIVAHVFVPTQAKLSPDQYAVLRDKQRQELDEWCAALPCGGPQARAVLVEGAPPDALLDAAHDQDADLLVVGGRGAGGFAHLHLGSVAHHLAHHTTVPLAIVPRAAVAPLRHIVIGVDGSPGSLAAVEFCADLAALLNVGVTAVYAFEPFVQWVPDDDPRSWHHQAMLDVGEWILPVEKAGVPTDVQVDRDVHPVASIARALDAHPHSVAMVGTRGRGGFGGLRLGRVPLQLVHTTGAAVILVPPGS